jgi:hypothetical protein
MKYQVKRRTPISVSLAILLVLLNETAPHRWKRIQ